MTFLLSLLSAVLIAVALPSCNYSKSSFYFACFYSYFTVFSRRGYCRLAAIVFSHKVAVLFFASLRHFYCYAIFITAVHYISVQPAIIAAFHSRLDLSFAELPCLLWSCRRHIHIAAKDVFVVTIGRSPFFFFAFLVVVLLVIFMPSCCSYCHCSTGSNSHTVVLSKPASYSPALFSIPVKSREHAHQSLMVVYGTRKIRQLCGYCTLAGTVKVRLRYGGSTRLVRCTHC